MLDLLITGTSDGVDIGVEDGLLVAPEGRTRKKIDVDGRLVTRGLVDCHTHLVFAGDRSHEWEMRLAGASYEEIARAGGGIRATVAATRLAPDDELFGFAAARAARLADQGVTTIEVKSGYGLDLETELRMLRVARAIEEFVPVRVVTTYLGAHTVPPEFDGDADGYIDFVCKDVLPAVAAEDLADAVDGFCESIAFSAAQIDRVFATATTLGLRVKLHADQLSDGGGAALAAKYHALSADHLEHASPEGIAALAGAGTVAVLLPGATYVLRETATPPVPELRAAGVPIAVATDCNPGTSPLLSPLLTMHLACTRLGLTVDEALAGMTTNAARALDLPTDLADLVIWDVASPAQLLYWLGTVPEHTVIFDGAGE
jgi:imidazolonepropionase